MNLWVIAVCRLCFLTKLNSIPHLPKNIQEFFAKVLTNACSLKYSRILLQESYNWIHICITLFSRTTLSRTTQRYAKRKYRRFWIALNCQQQTSVKDSSDFEFQSRLQLNVRSSFIRTLSSKPPSPNGLGKFLYFRTCSLQFFEGFVWAVHLSSCRISAMSSIFWKLLFRIPSNYSPFVKW